jgi:hypothetical protein
MFPTDNILCKVMHGINEYCIASIKYKKLIKMYIALQNLWLQLASQHQRSCRPPA